MLFDTKWFEALLRDNDTNQRQLAKLIGRDPSAISNVKKGVRKWQSREMPIVAQRLQISVDELLRHSDLDAAVDLGASTASSADEPSSGGYAPPDIAGMTPAINGALLGEILAIIERVYKTEGISVAIEQLGEMAACEYDGMDELSNNPAMRAQQLARIETRLRYWIKCNRDRIINSATFPSAGKKL